MGKSKNYNKVLKRIRDRRYRKTYPDSSSDEELEKRQKNEVQNTPGENLNTPDDNLILSQAAEGVRI